MTKVFTGPDPKPERRKGNSPRRIIDPAAVRRAKLRWRYCAACGRYANNGHHVLPKDHHPPGDDVEANIVGLCGSGTGRCHGAFHGSPYTDEAGERWTQEDVARAIGVELLSRRRDVIDYLFRKLGERADWFLLATYYVTVPE